MLSVFFFVEVLRYTRYWPATSTRNLVRYMRPCYEFSGSQRIHRTWRVVRHVETYLEKATDVVDVEGKLFVHPSPYVEVGIGNHMALATRWACLVWRVLPFWRKHWSTTLGAS